MDTTIWEGMINMAEKAKGIVTTIFNFIRVRQVGIMLTLMMCFLSFVMFSWGAAFWLNGLLDMHFDLGSCWQGIAAVTTGLVTVAGFAALPYVKYYLSSKYGTEEEEESSENNNLDKK